MITEFRKYLSVVNRHYSALALDFLSIDQLLNNDRA